MPGHQRKDALPLVSKKEQHGNTQESTRSGCHSNQPLVPAVAPRLLHPPSCSQGLGTQPLCTNCNLHPPSPLQGRLCPIAGYVLGGRGDFDLLLECHFKQLTLTEQHNKNSWASKTLETHKCPQLSSRSRASRNLPGSSETQPHRSHTHSNPSHAVSQGHQRYSLV